MKKSSILLFTSAFCLVASQIQYMKKGDDLEKANCVFVAEIGMILDVPMSYSNRLEYYFHVLEVLVGPDSLTDSYATAHIAYFECSEGSFATLTGSGQEEHPLEGDTVIVFCNLHTENSHMVNLISIESADSLTVVSERLPVSP